MAKKIAQSKNAQRTIAVTRSSKGRTIEDAVRDVCLWMPETSTAISHGSPHYRVRGKGFAYYSLNHHGDGRVALILRSPPGVQQMMVQSDPHLYFVPPYTGPAGWLGVHLNRGLEWNHIAALVREAYVQVAPKRLAEELVATPVIRPPTMDMPAEDLNPFLLPANERALKEVRAICADLPETNEGQQFGNPNWKVGKKSFCNLNHWSGRLSLMVWTGVDRQVMLTFDERYSIPAYMGHNGWTSLRLDAGTDWREVKALIRDSYEHFASKRMLQQLVNGTAESSAPVIRTNVAPANKGKRTSKSPPVNVAAVGNATRSAASKTKPKKPVRNMKR